MRVKDRLMRTIRSGLHTLVILNLLEREGVSYGYRLMVRIREVSGGVLSPSESTVYETLKLLERMGLIESFWGEGARHPRKFYRITEEGKEVLSQLNEEVRSILKVLEGLLRWSDGSPLGSDNGSSYVGSG